MFLSETAPMGGGDAALIESLHALPGNHQVWHAEIGELSDRRKKSA
jgi:hypothetical protein